MKIFIKKIYVLTFVVFSLNTVFCSTVNCMKKINREESNKIKLKNTNIAKENECKTKKVKTNVEEKNNERIEIINTNINKKKIVIM